MTEQQRRFVLDNENVNTKTLARLMNVKYSAVQGFRRFKLIKGVTGYDGCGAPELRRRVK